MVYVISVAGQPLMPTKRHGKVKRLLRNKQAKVVKRCPFTIQLLYDSKCFTQEITLEVASFDIQKIKNPEIEGAAYQQGEQLDFWNTREYVLFRDGHTCSYCKGRSKDKILNVHHIESRKTGGNSPSNLITLCETCHTAYHAGKIKLNLGRGKSFRDAAFMGIMRWAFYNEAKETYPVVSLTYGYLTKNTRITNNLEKSHCVDARCISGNPTAKPADNYYYQRFVRNNNRCLHKANYKNGVRKSNQAAKYVHGFQLFDKVRYNKQELFVFGRRSSGYFDIRTLEGKVVNRSVGYKKLKLLEQRRSLLTERRSRDTQFLSPPTLALRGRSILAN